MVFAEYTHYPITTTTYPSTSICLAISQLSVVRSEHIRTFSDSTLSKVFKSEVFEREIYAAMRIKAHLDNNICLLRSDLSKRGHIYQLLFKLKTRAALTALRQPPPTTLTSLSYSQATRVVRSEQVITYFSFYSSSGIQI